MQMSDVEKNGSVVWIARTPVISVVDLLVSIRLWSLVGPRREKRIFRDCRESDLRVVPDTSHRVTR